MASQSSSIAAIKRQRTAKLASLGTKAYYLHRRGQDDKMYSLICDEFVGLGGIYIKFLQGVLLQSEATRKWRSPDRLKIFENLDHEPMDIVSVLRSELSADKLAQITLVQPQPFAAGSFGQVYYGQHAGGKPIVVKVLRPMIRELLRYDLRLLGMFSRRMVGKMSANVDMEIDQAIKDFRAATLSETDYVNEAQFARELFEAYRNHPKLVIPETFLDLCTPNVIVQEYMDGLSVAQLIRMQEQGVDPRRYVREIIGSDLDKQLITLGIELLEGSFNLPRIQGDPHPGNIRLLPNDKVGMIDFGIAAPASQNKAAFFGIIASWDQIYNSDTADISRLFEQFLRFFVNDLYRALQRLATFAHKPTPETEDSNYTREVGKIAQEAFHKLVGIGDVQSLLEEGQILQVVSRMINKDNRFGLVVKLEASEILRALQTYMALVESLGRRNGVFPKVFAEVVGHVQKEHPELISQADESMSVSEALDTVSNWLERVANRDPALFRQLMHRIKLGSGSQALKPEIPAVKLALKKEKINA